MDVSVDARTRLAALIGDPVDHSLSPLIHNTAFQAQGLNHIYVAVRVTTENIDDAIHGLRALDCIGANVTAPHKQAVIAALDELSIQAKDVGAVNTIVRQANGKLLGDNTDITGFLAPLLDVADELKGAPMVILGSGGAARAVAYALLTTFHPENLVLAARTTANAERIAKDLSEYDEAGVLRVERHDESSDWIRRSLLVVNATPVGMHPKTNVSPLPDPDLFTEKHIVYDLVYNPEVTQLLTDAAKRRARTVGGLEMLIAQAAAAYVQWTGNEMPMDAVRKAVQNRSNP